MSNPSSNERVYTYSESQWTELRDYTIGLQKQRDKLREKVTHLRAALKKIVKRYCNCRPVEPREITDHITNEWADMATNGIAWLRNIQDGISTPVEALADMKSNLQRLEKLYGRGPNEATDALCGFPKEPRGMTYTDKLNEIRDALKAIAAQCVQSDEYECANAVIGAHIVISDVRNKLEEHGLGDDVWPIDAKNRSRE